MKRPLHVQTAAIAAVMASVLALGTACGSETPLQVVVGSIDRTALPALEAVTAWSDVALLAAAPFDDSGDFVLAIPPTNSAILRVTNTTGRAIDIVIPPLRICSPGPDLVLGLVYAAMPPCPPTPECIRIEEFYGECLRMIDMQCEMLRGDADTCHEMMNGQCEPEQSALDVCANKGGACRVEVDALNLCLMNDPCADVEQAFTNTCTPGCEDRRQLFEDVCTTTSGCMGSVPTFLTVDAPPPASIGCDEVPTP